jgi:GNAT superfamily N-acetyltransferase
MITIRPARQDEVQTLQNLNDKVFIDNHQYDDDLDMNWAQSAKGRKYFTELLYNPQARCLIAEEDGKSIGYIAAAPKHVSFRKNTYLEIGDMGVIPDYRSQGVGTLLMQECLKWGKAHGFHKVFVNAYFANTSAIAFYKRNGFAEIDVSLEREL